MTKTYIKPETTVVALNVRDNVLISASGGEGGNLMGDGGSTGSGGVTESDAREVIRSRSAWDEW